MHYSVNDLHCSVFFMESFCYQCHETILLTSADFDIGLYQSHENVSHMRDVVSNGGFVKFERMESRRDGSLQFKLTIDIHNRKCNS